MQRSLQPLAAAASSSARALWDMCHHQQIVIWLDNFYRGRHGTDPLQTDLSLNSSVMTVMPIVDMPPYPCHMELSEVIANIPALVNTIINMQAALARGINLVNSEPMQPAWIRVPLDIQRASYQTKNPMICIHSFKNPHMFITKT